MSAKEIDQIKFCIDKEEEIIRSAQEHIDEMKSELKAAGVTL